jgi:hypothetical protein
MMKEIRRLRGVVREYEARLSDGRDYLMQVNADEITVEDTIEAFGWTRNGLSERE